MVRLYEHVAGEAAAQASAAAPTILVAGVGNIFFGDDAFGVEVVRHLSERAYPAGVTVADFGIRGLDLAYALLDGYEAVILIDAVPRGGTPGELYVIDVDRDDEQTANINPALETHRLDPARVLQMVDVLGGRVGRLILVGCEPAPLADHDDIQPGMSEAARAAVPEAVAWVEALIAELRQPMQEDSHENADERR